VRQCRRGVPEEPCGPQRATKYGRTWDNGVSDRSHRALILNYFRARKQFSSGVVEGLNNKAKLTMRKSYGFRTFHVTEIALYHALGRLPEPDVAHRFF
jgi:Transposase